jgi:O-antigen ligase
MVRRLALMVSLLINILALVLMGNMSAMAGTVAGTAIGVAVSILDRRRAARSILFSAVVVGGAAVGVALLQSIMTEGQRFLMLARLNDSTSLRERFAVWHNVVRFLLETPGALLLGLGPDISIRRAGDPLLKQLFLGGGVQQAAVDSGYLYVALNFGLVALAVLMLAGADLVHRTGVAAIRRRDWMALLLCVGTGIWGIVAISQQHGISKPVFMIAQMAALAQVVTRSGSGDRAEDVG